MDENNVSKNDLVHSFNDSKSSFLTPQLMVVFILVILLGIGGGYFLSKGANSGPVATNGSPSASEDVKAGAVYGSNDTNTFKDTAEGTLQEGGIEEEGQFHLVRPGGDSQNVYLISSIVDLSKFVGKKIKVWGQTQQAKHAGWLMDVGKIQVE